MDAAAAAALSALAVFVSTVNQGAVRSAHGYRVVGRREWERWVEREFAFSPSACREVPLPAGAPRLLPTDWRGRPVFREGQLVGPWRCILAFDSVAGVVPPPTLPPLLSPSGNARLVCCAPSLYNDLLKLFPIQKLEKVPELIHCDSGGQKTPLDAKDVINKKAHIQCASAEQKTLLDAKDVIPKKVQTELIQCASAVQKTHLDMKDTVPKKVHTELIRCASAEQKTPLDTKESVSKKVHTEPIQCASAEQKTPLDTKESVPKKVHTQPIQCEQKTPLDTKDRICINVQHSGSYSDEQRTPLDTKDRIPIKVQQSDEHMTPLDTKDTISVTVQQAEPGSDEQRTPLVARDMIPIKVQQRGPDSDEQMTPLDVKDMIPVKVQQQELDSDEQMTPLDAKEMIPVKVQQPGPDSDEQMTPLDVKDMIPVKVQQPGPDSDGPPQSSEENPTPVQKQRRAQREYIASITLGDIAQYFHLPIREASRTLQIGLSILKKKCRQYGIPRWPHRKIKSLDSLIQDLEFVIDDTERDDGEQEENMQKENEKEDAIRSLAKRKRMLETEMATIQQKPTLDLMNETKQFRQFVFKRRYKAKHLVDE